MNEENTELSMIDCGVRSLRDLPLKTSLKSLNLHSNFLIRIENLTFLQNLTHLDLSSNQIKRIDGLHGLVSIRTLNLSCNSIVIIENLEGLRYLTWLNLSYNKINTVHGLSDIWGAEYSLETLLLHNNFITSFEELNYYLTGLKKLKHLTISDNKFLKVIDYRSIVFANLKCLQSLDNKDKFQKPVKIETKHLNKFTDYLDISTSINEEKINKFKQKRFVADETTEDVSKLELIEAKIHQLLSIRDTFKDSQTSSSLSNSSSSDESIPSVKVNRYKISPKKGILKNHDESFNSSKNLSDFVDLTKLQIESFKKKEEENCKLIEELRINIENLKMENLAILKKKEEEAKDKETIIKAKDDDLIKFKETNEKLTREIETLRKLVENNQSEQKSEQLKAKMKKYFDGEIMKMSLNHSNELRQKIEKIESLEKSYKSLEDEFRGALLIEANRYSDLFTKYESSMKESAELRGTVRLSEENESRNKSLIKELNDLIREQKERLQTLSKLRKETNEDVKKRNEKLSEAVTDCVKLKSQIETMRKEKKDIETQMKKIAVQFNQINKEKETWDQKIAEQKGFFMQENSRLDVETKMLKSELDLVKKSLETELDNVKIKTKMIEDQTETIKKLKSALMERDEMLKKSREEALGLQKSMEKQINEEMDLSNELQVKLDKANEKKESLKAELQETHRILEEKNFAYEELVSKWKQKSDLITELDVKVRKMKENFEAKEKALEMERDKAVEESMELSERVRRIDDEFRMQYDMEKREHLRIIEKTRAEYDKKLNIAESRIVEIEDEMRTILTESANTKKLYEDKIKSLSQAFALIQADIR